MNELEKRMNDLEIKFSYQEELLNELNIIVAKQAQVVDDMLVALKSLKDQSTASTTSPSGTLSDEKPPHY